MKSGKIVVVLVLVTALVLALASGVNAAPEEEVVWEYEGDYDDEITVEVSAPVTASPGDDITVTVAGEAKDDLIDVTMYIWIAGSEEEGEERWASDEERPLYREDLDDGDDFEEDYEFAIPDTADAGMILGHITCEWDIAVDEETETHSFDIAFAMTYLTGAISEEEYDALLDELDTVKSERDKLKTDYDALKTTYDSLKATYDTLKASNEKLQADYTELSGKYDDLEDDYSSLDSEHTKLVADYADLKSRYDATADELSDFKTYVYVLVGTTIIFVVTTIIFAVRKPRAV